MTITVYPDRIDFDNYTLRIDGSGVRVTSPTSSNISGTFSAAKLEALSPMFGTVSGYTSGGNFPTVNTIDKFPFASDANATDVGDLTQARYQAAGQSSTVSGYTSGGYTPTAQVNTIDKFPFASNANATDVGDLSQIRRLVTGQSSTESGYTSGGYLGPVPPAYLNTIDKFPFATNANATDVGDLTQGRHSAAGQSSSVSGYTSGGKFTLTPPPTTSNIIDKFPFATNANATDVGDLTQGKYSPTGQSSTISGYISGGYLNPGFVNTIEKFPFATNANATDVGDMTVTKYSSAGQSSSAHGYNAGGSQGASGINVIDKFPFATDADATDVGDLTQSRREPAGQQD